MMSKKQWLVVLCIFILYLLLGATIFHIIEWEEEDKRLLEEKIQQDKIDALIEHMIYNRSEEEERVFFEELSNYCGKPLNRGMKDVEQIRKWDFYYSLFFVITVVSTIGYGNLAPTTMFTRVFMIFYSLIGIPMNGIIMVTLGGFFGKSFTKLYQRWKTTKKIKYDTTRMMGLISQIILYLVPGFTFFIFLPSALMAFIENWDYDVAVYYCFVSLTTIGFGDYVAGVNNPSNYSEIIFWIYKIFLLVWVIGGLGYVVMILSFITKALQSKKMKEIENIIKQNIKRTPLRIRQELRTLLQEFLFMKVKRAKFNFIPRPVGKSQSCPDLNIYRNANSPTLARKRALSACPHHFFHDPSAQSDAESTQQASEEFMQQTDLLIKVVDALSLMDFEANETGGYEGLSDSEILSSERYGSKWSLRSQFTPRPKSRDQRRRAISDVRAPVIHKAEAHQDVTWYGQNAEDNYQLFLRERTLSEPGGENAKNNQNLLTRLKHRFISSKDVKNLDVEQNKRRSSSFTAEDRYLAQTNRGLASVMATQQQEAVLEQTSIADFIRALSAITVPDTMLQPAAPPKRKIGNAGLTPPNSQSPPRTRRLAIRPNLQTRRNSLMPDTHIVENERRRFSLRPVEENLLAPPPYSATPPDASSNRPLRKFSRTLNVPTISISPVQKQMSKREYKDDS